MVGIQCPPVPLVLRLGRNVGLKHVHIVFTSRGYAVSIWTTCVPASTFQESIVRAFPNFSQALAPMIDTNRIDLSVYSRDDEAEMMAILDFVEAYFKSDEMPWRDFDCYLGSLVNRVRDSIGFNIQLIGRDYWRDTIREGQVRRAGELLLRELSDYLPKMPDAGLYIAVCMYLTDMRARRRGSSDELRRRLFRVWSEVADKCGLDVLPRWAKARYHYRGRSDGYVEDQRSLGRLRWWGAYKNHCNKCGAFIGFSWPENHHSDYHTAQCIAMEEAHECK